MPQRMTCQRFSSGPAATSLPRPMRSPRRAHFVQRQNAAAKEEIRGRAMRDADAPVAAMRFALARR